jgi:hypothetical protein
LPPNGVEGTRCLTPFFVEITKKANQQTRKVTAELEQAKEKLKFFLNPQNSEIISAGQLLINAFSKIGDACQQVLLEKELIWYH